MNILLIENIQLKLRIIELQSNLLNTDLTLGDAYVRIQ